MEEPGLLKIEFPVIHGDTNIYMDCLKAICGNPSSGKSMIDLCCNKAPHTPLLGYEKRLYVDILPRTLDHTDEQKFFLQEDVLKLPFTFYSCSLCLDGIEHLSRPNGIRLISWMESCSERQVIFTPLDEWMMSDNTDPEGHHSLWKPEDFYGWASIVFPEYHPTLGIGAFFAWHCDGIKADFERVKSILMQKSWVKL